MEDVQLKQEKRDARYAQYKRKKTENLIQNKTPLSDELEAEVKTEEVIELEVKETQETSDTQHAYKMQEEIELVNGNAS